jgi:hypothetical protein
MKREHSNPSGLMLCLPGTHAACGKNGTTSQEWRVILVTPSGLKILWFLKFTWSSRNQTPTQTKIDHVFATKEWDLLHSHCHLQQGGTSMSDHCLMILTCSPFQKKYRGFRFESCWLLSTDFKDIVKQSWETLVSTTNKVRTLHIKLARLAKDLKKWHKQCALNNSGRSQHKPNRLYCNWTSSKMKDNSRQGRSN